MVTNDLDRSVDRLGSNIALLNTMDIDGRISLALVCLALQNHEW